MPPEKITPSTPIRVLVVDDDVVDRLRLVRLLNQAPGCTFIIEEVVDKAGAVAALKTKAFDCVLLDFRLPDGDGMDLLKEIHAAAGECPPVIMQTTLDHAETAIETLAQGAQDYLVKGRFNSAELHRAIRHAIQRDQLVKERNRLTTELQTALARVKTLEGLLPMCAWCKKMFQNEKGEWQTFDAYIGRHTNVIISHGVCSECELKYFNQKT